MARKFLIRTFGCQMNEHDSERLAGLFVRDGLEQTQDLDEADVVVLNTCCIRENADNKLYGHLGHLKSLRDARPGLQIAVGGCLAQREGQGIRDRAGHVDVVFGTHNLASAPSLLRRAEAGGPVVEVLDRPRAQGARAEVAGAEVARIEVAGAEPGEALGLLAVRESPFSAWVTIQSGCDNSCAFCIVPQVRGPEVSRTVEDVIAEVTMLAGRGVSEVTLLGQNVNSYGRDLTRRSPLFASLLRAVGAVEGIRRVRYTSPHPKDLRPETIAAMAEAEAVCEHLHLPLQSGSDRVLAAMRRGYRAEGYLEKLGRARAEIADLAVTTDVIVGFPGETEDDFEATLEVVAAAAFDSTYTFVFSPRPGTRAAAMEEDFVPAPVVAERFERLRSVVERAAILRHEARVGRVEEVLVEGPSKRRPSAWSGRTRQNKLVHFPLPAPAVAGGEGKAALQVGSYGWVKVTGAAPHHLIGEWVRPGNPPRRTAVPVTLSARPAMRGAGPGPREATT